MALMTASFGVDVASPPPTPKRAFLTPPGWGTVGTDEEEVTVDGLRRTGLVIGGGMRDLVGDPGLMGRTGLAGRRGR